MTDLGIPTNTTTTEDLERLLTDLPEALEGRGLAVSHLPMMIPRMPDMYFRHSEVAPADMAELIVAGGGTLAFLEPVAFDPLSLIDEETVLPEDAPEVDRILDAALARQGELSGILLTCPVQGLIWRWQALAGWVDHFQQQFDAAIEAAEAEEDQAHGERFQVLRAGAQELIAKVMDDPAYRGTPPHKRGAAAKRLAPEPVTEDDVSIFIPAMEGIAKRDREATELRNLEIRERLPELAADLVQTPGWINSHTVAARKRITGDFLAGQFEGWAVHAQVVDEVRAHAASRR